MNAFLAQYFFNSAFVAGGAALVASPIIIHLINRLRYKRVRFAAMEFLLQSQQRNRRRLLIEQLLLLLLRILIVLLLVALIARLVLDPNQLSLLRGGAKTHHVVLVDDSGSMRDTWDEATAFDRAKEVVEKLALDGARRPGTQQFTLLMLSDPDQPLFSQEDVNKDFVGRLQDKVKNLECTRRALDLGVGIDSAAGLLDQEKAGMKNLHVISDFRRLDWVEPDAMTDTIAALDEQGVAVNLVKTVPERHDNLAVTALEGDVQVAAAGVPLVLRTKVQNNGQQVAENVRLAVYADGDRVPGAREIDEIEPGEEVKVEFHVQFAAPGKHVVRVQVPDDALPQDNERHLAVDVADEYQVLVVDGDPGGSSSKFLEIALSPEDTKFRPVMANTDDLRRLALERFQCIFMLNVPRLAPDALKPLEEYVAGGGGLAWYMGPAVQPSFYNDDLYDGGEGLFPVPLGFAKRELREDVTAPGPDLVLSRHPIFEKLFEGRENPFSESVEINAYFPVGSVRNEDGEDEEWIREDNVRNDGVATIATLRNKQPVAFEHQYGEGRVVTMLTTIGLQWNRWALNPSYVPVILEIHRRIARRDQSPELRIVGEAVQRAMPAADYVEEFGVVTPDVDAVQEVRKARLDQPEDEEGEPRLVVDFTETELPGVYKFGYQRQDDSLEEVWYAFNVPQRESELELAEDEQIMEKLGETEVAIQNAENTDWIQGKEAGQEVRLGLLILLVVILMLEQLLAHRLSYHPRTAGGATE